jgi:hypothetical protein
MNNMKKVEIILGVSSVIAIAVNLIFAKSSNVFLVLLLSSTAVFYMYVSFVHFNNIKLNCTLQKNDSTGISLLRMAGTLMIGFSLSATTVGMAFVFLAWPEANFTLGVGLLGLLFGLAIGLAKQSITQSNFYKFLFKRVALYGFLGLILLLLPKEIWLEIKYRNHPTYIQTIKKVRAEPTKSEIWTRVTEERHQTASRD